MKKVDQKSHQTIFYSALGAQVLLPLASVAAFRSRYNYPFRTVCYHLLIVAGGYLAAFAVAALLSSARTLRARAATRYVLPLVWGSVTVGLYFSYLLAWGGRVGIGMNLTPAIALPYLLHPALTTGTLSISPVLFWGVLAVVPVAILLGYMAAAPAFSSVLLRLRVRMRAGMHTPLSVARQCQILAVAAGLIAAASVAFAVWPPPLSTLLGDPIFVSLLNKNVLFPIAGLNGDSNLVQRDYTPPREFQKKNVILIVLDACRADHLGVMGYERDTTPFLDSLQQAGHLHSVRSFYSASSCTFGGIMTLLRSQHWFNMTQGAFALQDVLKRVGYQVHFIHSGDQSNFEYLKVYYGKNLDSFSDGGSTTRHFGLNDDRGVFESFEQLASFNGTPAFLYFHLMSVHPLGPRLEANIKYRPASLRKAPGCYLNNYDNGIVQADNNIRDLFTQLARKGYLQNSIVVITGDHGESLGERNRYGHTLNLYAEEVMPPLLIYDPEPVTYRNLRVARQIDVAPTILDRLGLPVPSDWDGRSLLREWFGFGGENPRGFRIYASPTLTRSLITRRPVP